jgi:hypothetical protein
MSSSDLIDFLPVILSAWLTDEMRAVISGTERIAEREHRLATAT